MSNEQCHWPGDIQCAICLGRAAQIMCDAWPLCVVLCHRGIGQGTVTCMYSEKQQRGLNICQWNFTFQRKTLLCVPADSVLLEQTKTGTAEYSTKTINRHHHESSPADKLALGLCVCGVSSCPKCFVWMQMRMSNLKCQICIQKSESQWTPKCVLWRFSFH